MAKVILNGRLTDTENPNVSNQQSLQQMDKEEADAFVSTPNLDMKKYGSDRNLFALVGQGFADGLLNNYLDTPATTLTLSGKLNQKTKEQIDIEEAEAFSRGDYVTIARNLFFGARVKAELNERYPTNTEQIVAEKIRNFSLAIRHYTGLEQERIQAEGFGEKLAMGLGSGIASIVGMAATGVVGSAVMGPPGAVVGPYAFSFINEKAALSQQLMDAGYKAGFVDRVSDLYAYPVAALDFVSFRYLGKLLRPIAVKAITKSVASNVAKKTASQAIQATISGAKGFATEAFTEGLQQRIQTEFEIATKLRGREFAEDFTDDLVSFLVGGFIGGTVGVAGQMRARRTTINNMVQKYGVEKSKAAEIYNQAVLEAEILKYDQLTQDIDISESVKWVEKAFNKIQGRGEIDLDVEVTPAPAPIEFAFAEGLTQQIAAEKVDAQILKLQEQLKTEETDEAKFKILERIDTLELKKQYLGRGDAIVEAAEKQAFEAAQELAGAIKEGKTEQETEALSKKVIKATRIAEGLIQEKARVSGGVALTAAQVKKLSMQKLRQVINVHKTGIKMSQQEFKAVQKAFTTALATSKISDKAKARLLRQVLSVRTAEQFNHKKGMLMAAVNTVVRAEKVQAVQTLSNKILTKMTTDAVSPKNQVFAAHLLRVLNGTVPPGLEVSDAKNTAEMAKAIIENAVDEMHTAGDDMGTALRSFRVIEGYFKDQLQSYAEFKAREKDTFDRLAEMSMQAVTQGIPIDAVQEALDYSRQQAIKAGLFEGPFFAPYTLSFISALDMLDKNSGMPSMQGPMVKEFSPVPAFDKWVALTEVSRDMIDRKGIEIYGESFYEVWPSYQGQDFADVEIDVKEGGTRIVKMSRASAMSMWLTLQMPGLRKDLLNMGINEQWLDAFERGENITFSEKDYAWMQNVRDTLDYYADQIQPVYERLTGKPFSRIDNYYMLQRYMLDSLEGGSYADKNNAISSLLKDDYHRSDPANQKNLRKRVRSKKFLEMPDVFHAITSYSMDMNHFLAYADYVTKLKNSLQRSDVSKAMDKRLPPGVTAIINEYINTLAGENINKTADRKAMKWVFKLMGYYAGNKIATPKNLIRQLSSVMALTRYDISGSDFVTAMASLPKAIKSGEAKALLDTHYFKSRFTGMFDYAVKYSQDIAHAEYFSMVRKAGVLGKIRQKLASQAVHQLVTSSARYGDRAGSLIVGWTMYQKTLKATGDTKAAIAEAIRVVEETQQPINPGLKPVAFGRTDLPNRLLTLFNATTSSYLDQYQRINRAHKAGRISHKDWVRAMLAFHVWVPLIEGMITTGQMPWETAQYTLGLMATGPYAYYLIIGRALQALTTGLISHFVDGEDEIPFYALDVTNGDLITSFFRDTQKAGKAMLEAVEYMDLEAVWGGWKAIAKAGDALVPVPVGWIATTPEAVFEILTGDFEAGLKRLIGYSDYAIEQAKE